MRRTDIVAGALPFMIYIDGELACYLYNNKYTVFKLDTGKHEIVIQINGKSMDNSIIPYVIDVNSSGNIFVNLLMESNTEIACQEEKEYSARLFLLNLTSDDCKIGR